MTLEQIAVMIMLILIHKLKKSAMEVIIPMQAIAVFPFQ
jgi:hypothetical protein